MRTPSLVKTASELGSSHVKQGGKIGKFVGVRDLVEKSEPGSHNADAANDPANKSWSPETWEKQTTRSVKPGT